MGKLVDMVRRIVKMKCCCLLVIMLSMISILSCKSFYKVNSYQQPDGEMVDSCNNLEKLFFFHDEHLVWRIKNVQIAFDTLHGDLFALTSDELTFLRTNSANLNKFKDTVGNSILHEVHLYSSEYYVDTSDRIYLSIYDISRLEIYNKNSQATFNSYVFGFLAITLLLPWSILYLILPKPS